MYAGSAPTLLCGVVQINMQVPATWTTGNYMLQPWLELMSQNGTSISTHLWETFVGSTIVVK